MPARRPLLPLLMAACVLALACLIPWSSPTPAHADGDPAKLQLVLDASGSMKEKAGGGTTKIAAAKTALRATVGSLPADLNTGLRVYGATVFAAKDKGACTDSQQVVAPGTNNRAALLAAVDRFEPYGETPIGYALQQAAKDLGSTGQRTIVLVSDGIATCAPDPCVVAGQIAAMGIDLHIDVVGLGVNSKTRSQLECIADRGNGTYYDADDSDDLTDSLVRLSTRAARPFGVTGQKVSGATTGAADATPIDVGTDYVDTLGKQGSTTGVRYYEVTRSISGSTIHANAVARSLGDFTDYIGVSLIAGTEQCDQASAFKVTRQNRAILSATAVTSTGVLADPECTSSDTLVFKVMRGAVSGNLGGSASLPMQLHVTEEPPVKDTSKLPRPVTADWVSPPSGTGPVVVGGVSVSGATVIKPGNYRSDIVPGESLVYAVDLDWGQVLSTQVLIRESTQTRALGYLGPYLQIQVFGPDGTQINGASRPDSVGTTALVSATGQRLTLTTPPVRYLNRAFKTTSLPGRYLIVVGMGPYKEAAGVAIGFELAAGVTGKVGGAPDYVTAGTPPTPSPTSNPSVPTSTPPTTSPSGSATVSSGTHSADGPPADGHKDLIAATLAALGLLAVAGAIMLTVRRRA
jgi:Ca-activated chloride channel family protein